MSKLRAVKTLFEIGKLAAETYDTIVEGKKKNADIEKDRKIAELEAEVRRLKGPTVDKENGEWRCRCPSDPSFDKSINPAFVKRCNLCGAERPA